MCLHPSVSVHVRVHVCDRFHPSCWSVRRCINNQSWYQRLYVEQLASQTQQSSRARLMSENMQQEDG